MKNSNQEVSGHNKQEGDPKRLSKIFYESVFGVFLWFFIPFNLLLIFNEPFQVKRSREVIQERLQSVDHGLRHLAPEANAANVKGRNGLYANLLKRKNCYQRIINSGWSVSTSSCLNSTGEDFKRNETLQDYRFWVSPGFYLQRIFWLFMPLYLYLLNKYWLGPAPGQEKQKPRPMKLLKVWLSLRHRRT